MLRVPAFSCPFAAAFASSWKLLGRMSLLHFPQRRDLFVCIFVVFCCHVRSFLRAAAAKFEFAVRLVQFAAILAFRLLSLSLHVFCFVDVC